MTAGSPERLNIRQVAQIAGVSHMTVSRVLRGQPTVKESTRQRVLEVVNELNFQPNSAARALASRRTRRIGVMIENGSAYGPLSTLRSVEEAARAADFSVTSIALLGSETMTPEDAIAHLTAQGVEALCAIAPRSSSVSALRRIRIDVPVLVVKADPDPTFLTVSVDQHAGAELVVDHLAALGHRDVLHVAGPLDWLDARARERAFHVRAKEWRMRQRPIVVGDWTADFGYDYARRLEALPPYTAIFAGNDDMALGLVHGLYERGIRVPEDISIVGFDDVPGAPHFLPPLTTVRQDFDALGGAVVDALSAAAEGQEIPQRTRLSVELKVRASTAAPREA
ncbi:LacI family DNA-binding transcriptional regulator [Ruania albidiflava]|uniref:LacI family DNA-binding transcriptional regulator n=1 Tax=Ruania albidiflava TaxID=366586 RepID=UPI0003B72620|nr:LacI family DNA-binding transcriptional regulator [Ruania albidiflava]HLS64511.1 LacI family DNA-binding transcriptional regulator [Ruania sp.]